MLRFLFLFTISQSFLVFLHSEPDAILNQMKEKYLQNDIQAVLSSIDPEIQKTNDKNKKAELLLLKARALWKDQNEEKALSTFMQSLSCVEISSQKKISLEENENYSQFFQIYLQEGTKPPQEVAHKLQELVIPYLEKNPTHSTIQFLHAAILANLGKLEDFFPVFLQSYKEHPDHFMAHKTKGVLYVLLYEKATSQEVRKEMNRKAIFEMQKALHLYPEDVHVHKILFMLADKETRKAIVEEVFQIIFSKNIQINRTLLPLYVNQALIMKDPDLAERFIEKARTWYETSRILHQLQQTVDEFKKTRSR